MLQIEAASGCIGPKAAYKSIKSIVCASDFLSRDPDAPEDSFLGVAVSENKKAPSGSLVPTNGLLSLLFSLAAICDM